MDINDPAKPRNLLGWRGQIAQRQADLGLKPDPVPTRVTTISAPGAPRAPALVRDALNPQNLAANRAEAMPFANQVSGPRYAPDGTGRRQGGVSDVPPPARPGAPTATPATPVMAVGSRLPAAPLAKLARGGSRPAAASPAAAAATAAAAAPTPPVAPAPAQPASPGSFSVLPAATPAAVEAPVVTPALQRPNAVGLANDAIAVQREEGGAAVRAAQSLLNPMSAQSEIMRRLENSQSSFFNKGSPSARAFAAEALLGQLRAGNAAQATQQEQVGNTAGAGASEEARLGADAAEGDATRADARDARALSATLRREELDAAGPVLQLQGGTTARLGRDGVARSIRGEDGQPVRGQAESKALDPNEVFKAAAAARGEIANNSLMDPEQRAAALAEFDASPLGQSLAAALQQGPQTPAARPSLDQFLSAARAANPGASDETLRAYYEQNYGSNP